MSESHGASAPEVRARLDDTARLLRESDAIDPAVRSALVECSTNSTGR